MREIGGYVRQLRPCSWPSVLCHYAAGFLIASGFRQEAFELVKCLLGGVLWAVFLNGGALALDSALDRARREPEPPRFTGEFAVLLMFAGLMMSLLVDRSYAALFLTCYVLAVCYSSNPVRLKARPGLGHLTVSAGYGFFTVLAGWAASGRPFELKADLIGAGFFFLLGGVYPLVRRGAADEAGSGRAYPGPSACAAFFVSALVFFVLAATVGGVRLRTLALLPPAACWVLFLIARLRDGREAASSRIIWAACAIWLLTDACCILAFMP